MRLRVLALVGLVAVAPSVPIGVRAAANHDWRGSELPPVREVIADEFVGALNQELRCEDAGWSPRCPAELVAAVRQIQFPWEVQAAADRLVADLTGKYSEEGFRQEAGFRYDARAVLRALMPWPGP